MRKAIMHRSQLETKNLKTKTQTDLKLYKKHKNFSSKLYKRERRKYYESLDMKKVLESKIFWKTMGPFFSLKTQFSCRLAHKKITELYLIILSLALSLKMLLGRSMLSQMNR